MNFVIDIQGFREGSGKLILKEVAVVTLDKDYTAHWIASAPHPFTDLPIRIQVQNNSITNSQHGLEWFDGDIPLRQLHANLRYLTRGAGHIFVLGAEKTALVQSITTRYVENLEDYNCPSLNKFVKCGIFCYHHGVIHSEKYECALNNATNLKRWINRNIYLPSSATILSTDVEQKTSERTDYSPTSSKPKKSKNYDIADIPPAYKRISNRVCSDISETSSDYCSTLNLTKPKNGNEYSSNKGGSATLKNTFSGCLPCGQNPEGVDETDGYHSQH